MFIVPLGLLVGVVLNSADYSSGKEIDRKEPSSQWRPSRQGRRPDLGGGTDHRSRKHVRRPDKDEDVAIADMTEGEDVELSAGGVDGWDFINQHVKLMGGTLQEFLTSLKESGEINERQRTTILTKLLRGQDLTMTMHRIKSLPAKKQQELRSYILGQTDAGHMLEDTAEYIATLLNLELHPQLSVGNVARTPAPAFYTGNGNVRILGSNLDVDPPSAGTDELYNGIWGHATATREYALQCNSNGLHIIDVTDASSSSIYRVQFIPMPGGTVWRDVQTHFDASSGKTYAYVAAQSNGNFWVVDLSELSIGEPHGPESNPITNFADRGRTDFGHTLFLFNGLLFLNTANSDSCQIFDIDDDPWDPPLLRATGVRDCHDSTGKVSIEVTGLGPRDLLISSGGYESLHHVLDLTDVRNSGNPVTLLGETVAFPNTYAHSSTLTEDNRYLYAFEESNSNDISVYDLLDVTTGSVPVVTHFKWSGDGTESAIVHNGHVRGNYLHVAYYEAGYRVFDISNPNQAVEVGKYETWRDPDGDGNLQRSINGNFDGAWNLAFLPSGKVILSDTSSGTFVFETDPIALPSEPLSLQASLAGGGGQVDLSWTVPATGTPAGYTVYRGVSSGQHDKVATNVVGTSFTDTTLTQSGTYYYVVSATNAEGESAASNEASVTINTPCIGQQAIFDSVLGVPACPSEGCSCDTGTSFIDGRGSVSPGESNQPNTLDGCTDGNFGTYHSDESLDRLRVSVVDGNSVMVEGALVEIEATVWAWSTFTADRADFYHTADANNPSWTYIGTVVPSQGGENTLTQQYTLPAGPLQAVRVSFRYQGSAAPCSTGSYDDADDLVFAVASPSVCTIDEDCEPGLKCIVGACSTSFPSLSPSQSPSGSPSSLPSHQPSDSPTSIPSRLPSEVPTKSASPSSQPSNVPSISPSSNPSESFAPSSFDHPSSSPSKSPSPSSQPSHDPTRDPTRQPSSSPSDTASMAPTQAPSQTPSNDPSSVQSFGPSAPPSEGPSFHPSLSPSSERSALPSALPSLNPSSAPTAEKSEIPSIRPSRGPTYAEYDSSMNVPACLVLTSHCDTGTELIRGRANILGGPEPNEPNTLDTCTDGNSGTFHSDESLDRVVVTSVNGLDMREGSLVEVSATVWAWSNGAADSADFFYAQDANNPQWTRINTIVPSSGGEQTLSVQYTLPAGSMQAVRVQFRYQGTDSPCSNGDYDDVDDLAFVVGELDPPCGTDEDCDPGFFCVGGSCSTAIPSSFPSHEPSFMPSSKPSESAMPSLRPSSLPSASLSHNPSSTPSGEPSSVPSTLPSESSMPSIGTVQAAAYDSFLGVPACAVRGIGCDTEDLIYGRGTSMGPAPDFSEANQPNTIRSTSCNDGTDSGNNYLNWESVERITVRMVDGSTMQGNSLVVVEAEVWAWSSGNEDAADFWYTADANAQSVDWDPIGTVVPPAGGRQVLTQQYTLPAGGTMHAVRVNFRWQGSASTCSGGAYADTDDLAFFVP